MISKATQAATDRSLAITALLVLLSAIQPGRAVGHGEQISTGGGGGPVVLGAEQRTAIGLETAEAAFHDIDTVLPLNAIVALDPDRHVFVSTRVEGRVERILVRLGQPVVRDQPLAVIQSRLLGNPPPTVTVTAPMAGVVDDRLVAPGEAVDPSKTLFHIADLAQVIVQAEAYEDDIGKVALDLRARLQVPAYPGEFFEGTVTYVGQQLDAEKRTLPVWITVANPAGRLKPGMFAQVTVVLRQLAQVLAIPRAALLEAGGEHFVFVDTGTTLTRTDVRTGANDDRFVEIVEGLVPGDRIVTQGVREVYTAWLTGGATPRDAD